MAQFHTSDSPDSATAERLEARRKAHRAKDDALAESHAELVAALTVITSGSDAELVRYLEEQYGENDKYWLQTRYVRWRNRVQSLAQAALVTARALVPEAK